jgi:NADH-quinone oxidoreductase subunit E
MTIATYYDKYHVEPVGEHLLEVCTNVCCALLGAQPVLDAFERELGVKPGETTEDGAFTLRAVECLGGCSTPPIVAVDHGDKQSVQAADVPRLVEEARARRPGAGNGNG